MNTIIVRSNGNEDNFETSATTVGELRADSDFREDFGFPADADITVNGAPAGNGTRISTGDVISYAMRSASKGIEAGGCDCPEGDKTEDAGEPPAAEVTDEAVETPTTPAE